MTVSFDSSLLTSYFNSKLASANSGSAAAQAAATKATSPTGTSKAPTAPWERGGTNDEELVKNILAGKSFVRESATNIDVAGSAADYKKLYTLYTGLSSLRAVASKAQSILTGSNADSITNTTTLNTLRRNFSKGLTEVSGYVKDAQYEYLDLIQGKITDKLKSTVGVAKTDTNYFAKDIHQGTATDAVDAFQGDVKFNISIKTTGSATPKNVSIDLSEMGSDTRSMSNVVNYINGKLKDAGASTKFEVQRTPGTDKTVTVSGKTTKVGTNPDTFSLKIKGDTTEALTFSAPTTADSIFMVQSVGNTDKTTEYNKTTKKFEEVTPEQTMELVKFQADATPTTTTATPGDTYWTAGRSVQEDLADSITKVHQTVSGPDGSVYVLADVNGTIDGQTIKGTQDVALIKYDSAGKVVYTRTLGAADTATGYALAVSDDGKVAIAGSVTGSLPTVTTTSTSYTVEGQTYTVSQTKEDTGTSGTNATVADSFVTVFDADGVEQWTKRRGSTEEDMALGVTFGADGSVYVAGKARGVMLGGGGSAGGWDSYVMGFDATGKSTFTTQSGTAGTDQASAVKVVGNTMYVAGIEDSNMVLKAYDLSVAGKATLTGTRNLGGLGGGQIGAIDVYNGQVYVGGSSGNANILGGGTGATAFHGGQDAFAATVNVNFADTSGDKVVYYGGTDVEDDVKVQFSSGKVYFSGQTEGEITGTTKIGEADAFIARMDVASGAVEWSQRYTGKDGEVNPNAMAVSKGGASVLDRLGLPQGTIKYTDSTLITSATSTRAGDSFYLRDSRGSEKKITIEASDTLETLAKKIQRAAGYTLKVTVAKVTGKAESQLVIEPANKNSSMEIVKGPAGKDALEGLGLSEGLITTTADTSSSSSASKKKSSTDEKLIGLNFNADINLTSEDSIVAAIKTLDDALKNVRAAYRYLRYGEEDTSDDAASKKTSTASSTAYWNAQSSNYAAALSRLTGGA
ncbi:transcriptional regulator [Asticcacaulis sp. BYS171W]|uniref:Transcriptional regulator n=1 Tax=Asticcacaulis aquaticus TaxID=2984212 RepID=A0ABT5HW78_9CAUL|nr:transcriptional regulator [Asticcacaulis aquaticus]MDC7684342.1 transcriptional regulator [Asticcacaulis aquaticus]